MTTSDISCHADEASTPAAIDRSADLYLSGENGEAYIHERIYAHVGAQAGERPKVACHTVGTPSISPVYRLSTILALVMFGGIVGCQKPTGDTGSSPVPSETGSGPTSDDMVNHETAPEPDPSSEGFDLTRRLGIGDLADIPSPGGPAPTTAALPRRSEGAERRTTWPGLVVHTTCRGDVCLDSLVDDGTTVIEPTASETPDEGWIERVVRVPWANGEYVSAYIATSRRTGDAAHANNRLRCHTFRRQNGEPLSLEKVLGESAASRLIAKANSLLDEACAIEVLGRPLDAAGYTFTLEGFRFGRTAAHDGPRPEIILCAEGPHPRDSGHILEMRLEAMPVGYLLRRSMRAVMRPACH